MRPIASMLSAAVAGLLLMGSACAQSANPADTPNATKTADSTKSTKSAQVLKDGEQVYRQVCIACHDSGVAHAPKLGDKEAWAPLIEEGQGVLTAHAWVGVRAMPAKGGEPELALEEFARAVAWMTSEAGAEWKAPDARMMRTIRKEAEMRLDEDIRERQKMRAELHRLNERSR